MRSSTPVHGNGYEPLLRFWKAHAKVIFIVMLSVSLLSVVTGSVHMVYVAFESQPGCVPHVKANGSQSGTPRAAKSSC